MTTSPHCPTTGETPGLTLTRRSALAGAAAAGIALAAPALARAKPPRIVTIGSGVTETVFALGRGGDVVATDAASLYPHGAAALPKLSYPKALSADDVLAQRPDIVLLADEAGPKAALEAAAASGARIVRTPEVLSLDDIAAGVRLIAEAIAEPSRGEELAQALGTDLALVDEAARGVRTRRRALALLGPTDAAMLIAAGRGSPAAVALGFAGAENAAGASLGWAWMTPAAARDLDPDVVVALSGSDTVSIERVLASPCVRGTAAGRERRVATVEGPAFTGFGPRAAHALHAVASRIYPELRFPAPPPRPWAEIELSAL